MPTNPHGEPVDKPSIDKKHGVLWRSPNAVEAQNGPISIGPINRTMLDEGTSVAEYIAARDLAVSEGLHHNAPVPRVRARFTEKVPSGSPEPTRFRTASGRDATEAERLDQRLRHRLSLPNM